MDKKALIIINPCAGTKKANRYLTEIVNIFVTAGFAPLVLPTTKRGDGTAYAKGYADKVDLITCIGGDGTFNEVVSGIIQSGIRVPIGYIPAGSTNDFANSLHLSKDILQAARNIVNGNPLSLDVGSFNGRTFSYVASFGAFTKTSYDTPQNVKNALGHMAYILQGVTSIKSIKSERIKIEANGVVYEDDYIFGAISNSTSIAGILKLRPEFVDMSDGFFELLLVKSPKDIIQLTEILRMISVKDFESKMLTFINAKKFKITANKDTSWTLDGEYQEGNTDIEVVNMHRAIEILV